MSFSTLDKFLKDGFNDNPSLGILMSSQQSGNYTLQATDVGTVVEGTSALAQTFTIPQGLPVGSVIEIFQYGAGQITVAAASGVTLRSDGSHVNTAAQYATIGLRIRAANECVLSGDLA